MNILQQLADIIGTELAKLREETTQGQTGDNASSFLGLRDTPSNYEQNKRNLKVNLLNNAIELVHDNMIADGEFRGFLNSLLHHQYPLKVTAGDELNITNISQNHITFRTSNGTVRNLRLKDEFGMGGRDVYIRVDEGEPMCMTPDDKTNFGVPVNGLAGDYDKETNSCFPADQVPVPASTFEGVWKRENSTLASGVISYNAKVRILKTGEYATGWIDVHTMHSDIAKLLEDFVSQNVDILSLQNQVATLQQATSSLSAPTYTKESLPLNGNNSDLALVTDGSISGSQTMSYFYDGSWFRTFDNSLISDQTIDIYLLAGQSNAHGHAKIEHLTDEQKTQDGLFYSSWHQSTSNASTTQYYSPWATSLVAGNTRGDSGQITLGGSSMFGPELGFVSKANEINLTGDKPIGIIKHAIGASSLVHPDVTEGDLSDWDLTPEGDKHGDALVAFKRAIQDGLQKLTDAGYSYRIAGMVWWQGESGATTEDLNALIAHLREYLDVEFTLDMPREEFPVVITTTTSYWGQHLIEVSNADAYVGVVNTMDYASPEGASRTLVHPGSNETYPATQAEVDAGIATNVGDPVGGQDYNGDGVNDMFSIGEAYAEQMQKAITGSTNSLWTPEALDTLVWLDMDDTDTLVLSGDNVTTISDKSGNGYNFLAHSGSTLTSVQSSQNGKYALRFDNNSDATSYKHIGFSANTKHNWFFVVKVTHSDNHDALVTFSDGNPTLQIILFNLSGSGVFSGDWYFNPAPSLQGNSANLLNEWALLSLELDVPNTRVTAKLNGTAYDENVTNSGISTMDAGSVRLNDYVNNADSDWGELVFLENASDADIEKMEGYLAHKWGLQGNLPTGHTYKDSAP